MSRWSNYLAMTVVWGCIFQMTTSHFSRCTRCCRSYHILCLKCAKLKKRLRKNQWRLSFGVCVCHSQNNGFSRWKGPSSGGFRYHVWNLRIVSFCFFLLHWMMLVAVLIPLQKKKKGGGIKVTGKSITWLETSTAIQLHNTIISKLLPFQKQF